MDLHELRRIREHERETDSLQSLREDFYVEVAGYLDELTDRRDRIAEQTSDPFGDPEVREISDEVSAARRTVEALHERRVGKIVKLASLVAADMASDVDGLTREEEELFETIVETIRDHRRRVLETVESADETLQRGAENSPDPATADTAPADANTSEVTADGEQDSQPAPAQEREDDIDRTTVRITEDIGEIVGVDERPYDLGVDDVVTLPTINAEPLLDRDAAERIE